MTVSTISTTSSSTPPSSSSLDLSSVDVYSFVIIVLAAVGIVVNVASLVILIRKGSCSMFHNLLKILAISDFVVVNGCALLYALPDLWYFYSLRVYPVILPYLLPVVQIAMMTSVYSTIVMSFERYVRIGHTCRLRACSYITSDNFKYYVTGIIICPMIFYIPKFFELRTVYKSLKFDLVVDCSFVLQAVAGNAGVPSFDIRGEEENGTASVAASLSQQQQPFEEEELPLSLESPFLQECLEVDINSGDFRINITKSVDTIKIEPTDLSQNLLYYKIYWMGLNTIFASIFPLVSLLYFNIYTVIALRKMGRENDVAAHSRMSNSVAARDRMSGGSPSQLPHYPLVQRQLKKKRQQALQQQHHQQQQQQQQRKAKLSLPSRPSHSSQQQQQQQQQQQPDMSGKRLHTSSRVEMCLMEAEEEQRQNRTRRKIRFVRMKFVRETFELRAAATRRCKCYEEEKRRLAAAKKGSFFELSSSLSSSCNNCRRKKGNNNSNNSGGSISNNSGGRARSESQSEYSPKRRNDKLIMRRNGMEGKLEENFRCKHRRSARNNRESGFRRRANSAPEEIRTFESCPSVDAVDYLAMEEEQAEAVKIITQRSEEEEEEEEKSSLEERETLLLSASAAAAATASRCRNSNNNNNNNNNARCSPPQLLRLAPPRQVIRRRSQKQLLQQQQQPTSKPRNPVWKVLFFMNRGSSGRNNNSNNRRSRRNSNSNDDKVSSSSLFRRSENRITRIALAIVWLFLFCHFWKLVPTFYEALNSNSEEGSNWPSWLMHVHDISHSLIVFNSAVNFLLYTVL